MYCVTLISFKFGSMDINLKRINATQYTRINAHSYKMLMYVQSLHPFCNIHILIIPARYYKIDIGKKKGSS